jgi:hypothetical protein
MPESKGKPNRSNLIISACVVSCFSFAYGFSNQNTLFQWVLPVAIPLLAAAWSFRPRSVSQGKTRESA